jgi:signal transduction histidine kinase/CheY-like chemotaxis protein
MASSANSSQAAASAESTLSLTLIVVAACLCAGGLALTFFPGVRTPTLHTILDTSIFLTTAILALLLWQIGLRAAQLAARLLAITFSIVAVAELLHTLTALEGSPVAGDVAARLTDTWGPSTYLLPIGLFALTAVQRLDPRRTPWLFAAGLSGLAVGLLLLFGALPTDVPPGPLARPTLVLAPLLWLAAGLLFWRYRARNDVTRALALMAALLIVPFTVMLFSRGPYDAPALFAHLGKLAGLLFLLLSLTQLGARSSAQLMLAERDLHIFNAELERRIAERTAELEQAKQKLSIQVDRLRLLHQITRAIGDRLDLGSIFQVVVRSLEDRLPVDFASVCTYDGDRRMLRVSNVGVASMPLARELAMAEQSEICIDSNGLSHCVGGDLVCEPDIAAARFPFPERLARGGLRSLVISPLVVERRTFGVLVLARKTSESFSSPDCEFVRQLCEHVALAIHQAQLHGTLQHAYDDLRLTQQAATRRERLNAIGQLASGIAHDINNAISPVAIYTQSLLERDTGVGPEVRRYLETVRRVINDVAATVGRMREFYRSRDSAAELEPVELNELVMQTVDLTRARWSDVAQQRGIVISVKADLAHDLPPVPGVPSEIREALTNLVFNAVDAMPGGGMLTLSTHAASGSEAPVEVAVSDIGVGMDEDTRRRCLEPFFTTKGERGTGLGLAMVYGMAQRHNARVEIESEPGRGTTFRLLFPQASKRVAAAAIPEPAKQASPRLRILLIDDDPFILDSMRVVLGLDGHAVTEANGGQAGIDAFAEALRSGMPFDVVITDLGMPEVGGSKVIEAVKAASAATPVILMTGWGQRLERTDEAAPSPLPDFVVPKPPDLETLRDVFRQIAARQLDEVPAAR